MSDLTADLSPSDPARATTFTRLDTIFASTEQALARAEESLRKAQQVRFRSTSRIRVNLDALWRFHELHSRQ